MGLNRIKLIIAATAISSMLLSGCSRDEVAENTDKSTEDVADNTEENTDENTEAVSENTVETTTENVETEEPKQTPEYTYNITIAFTGDINLAEEYGTTDLLDSSGGDITECISPELIDIMRSADLCIVNNEFTYSDRGEPLPGKMYTFRAGKERVQALTDMGVDAVYLANNHVYDYGEEALLDTFDTLDGAGIAYFGAGHNIEEATAPMYVELQGKKIAFCAASRAEKNKMTPQATENTPGILRLYDTELFTAEIKEASENADFTIAVVHWGTEYSTELEAVQVDTAKEYVESGADVTIGAHTHCLQGAAYVENTPVIYSLGNYWFNEKTLDTEIALVHIFGNDDENHIEVELVPGIQENWYTRAAYDDTEKRRIWDDIEAISEGIFIDNNGIIREGEDTELIDNLPEVNFDVDYPVGQITSGVCVSQSFISNCDVIDAVSLYGATYTRDNTATVDVELLYGDTDDENVIAKWKLDSSLMSDNTVINLPLSEEITEGVDACISAIEYNADVNTDLSDVPMKIRISSPDGMPDKSPTFWMTEENIYEDGCLNVAGYDQYNDLWFQIFGKKIINH